VALTAVPLFFVLVGLTCYIVLAGADFGAAIWQITASQTREGRRIRDFAHNVMAPVWEANHVWLIFVLTVTWTAYPAAFRSIASTLSIALIVAALGIVIRGAAYAVSAGTSGPRQVPRPRLRLRHLIDRDAVCARCVHRWCCVGASPIRQGRRGSRVELAQPDLGGRRRAGHRDLRLPGRRLPL